MVAWAQLGMEECYYCQFCLVYVWWLLWFIWPIFILHYYFIAGQVLLTSATNIIIRIASQMPIWRSILLLIFRRNWRILNSSTTSTMIYTYRDKNSKHGETYNPPENPPPYTLARAPVSQAPIMVHQQRKEQRAENRSQNQAHGPSALRKRSKTSWMKVYKS